MQAGTVYGCEGTKIIFTHFVHLKKYFEIHLNLIMLFLQCSIINYNWILFNIYV